MSNATSSRVIAALSTLVLFAVSENAWASPACSATKINVIFPESPAWLNATTQLTERLRKLEDLDRCAHILVRPNGAGADLYIVTGDGREAMRHVETVAELLRAAEALLVLPPQPAHVVARSPLEEPPPEQQRPPAPSALTHVELGAGGSLRIGGGPFYAGGGLSGFAQFALDRWLLAVSGRWDIDDAIVNQPTARDFRMQASVVGVSVGRRMEFANAVLDTLLGPNVVLESQDADDVNREVHGAAADFRLASPSAYPAPNSRPFAPSSAVISRVLRPGYAQLASSIVLYPTCLGGAPGSLRACCGERDDDWPTPSP